MSPTPFWHRRSKGTCEKQAKPARQRWARIRPQVEQLEDRLAPAVLLWDGGPTANGTDWNTAANWAGDVLPAAADDVRIDAPFSGIAVTHTTADTTIRSLTSAASLQIDSGSFAIVSAAGAPASQIDGPLNVIGGALTFDGATLNGPGQLINAATLTITTSTINAPLDNQGTLVNQGSSAINGNFRSDPASTLQLGNQSFGDSVLTFADGFTNRGAIELTESAGRGFSDTLRVSAGTLTNAATGTISSLPGSGGGVRTLAAQLDNQGTLTVEQALTIDKVSAAHTNSGTISVASGQTLTISTGVLTNLNAGTLTGGTYLIAGTFQFPDAAITTNAATIVLDGTDARIVNPPNGNALSALASNLAGASLALRNGASLATQAAVTNAGDLTIDVASKLTITGDYTQTATGTFVAEIGGNPASAQVGRLSTSGQAHLDGTIHVSLVNGFGPLLGQIYIVQTFAGHVGDFATQTGLNLGRVPVFEVGTFATSVRLNVLVDAGDLAADANSIGLPSNGTTGEDVQVTYTVRDTSTTPVPGDWIDSLYLSNDARLDAGDALIGRVEHTGGLDGLASYTTTATFALPGTVEGDYRVIVVTDSRGLAPDRGRGNNTAISNSVIRTRLPILTLGQTTSLSLDGGEQRFFRLDVPPGIDVQFGVNFSQAGPSAPSGVFVLFGEIPTPGSFEQSALSSEGLHQNLLLLGTAGPHYVLSNPNLAGNVQTIDLTPVPLIFSLQTIIGGGFGSNLGQVTKTITGTGFTPDDGAVLQNGAGVMRAAQRVLFKDSNTLFVTFDLAGLEAGNYDLKVTRAAAATNALAFTVTPGGKPGHVTFKVFSEPLIRPGTTHTVTIDHRNDGDTDVPAPLVQLRAEAAKVTPANFVVVNTVEGSGGGGGGGNSAIVLQPHVADLSKDDVELQFLGIDARGLGGVLAPGASGHAELEFRGSDLPSPPFLFFTAFIDKQPAIANPNFVKDTLRPPTVSPEAWDVLFARFLARVGSTDFDFQTALDDAANYLSQLGQSTPKVAQLTAFIVEQVDNAYPGGILAASIDAAAPAAGLPLALARVYSQPISRRYELGAFGRGWLHSYEMTLHKVDDELVIVHGPGGDRAFQKETIPELAAKLFNFKGQFGDPGRFSTDDVLLEPDGTEYSFGRDGLLSSITDSNGNTIRLNYTAGRLTSAVHSNGDSFTFVYNAQGRISQVTDQAGRATAYDYDAAGEHLLQVTGPQGTVAYTVTVQPTAGRSGSLGAFL